MRSLFRALLLAIVPFAALTPLPVRAAAVAAAAACGRDAIVLPILGEDGAVVVPVTLNGVPAAAAVNPHATPSLVTDPTGLALPRQGGTAIDTLLGHRRGYESTINVLGLGDAVLPGRHAIVLDAASGAAGAPLVAGRRLAMVLGADVLAQFSVLMDLPGHRLLLIPDNGAACPDPAALLSFRPVAVPLRDAPGERPVIIDAVLDGLPLPMELDLGSNDSIVSRAVARRLGISRDRLDRDPAVLTSAGGHRVGARHRFGTLSLGAVSIAGPSVDVQADLSYAVLGLDLLGGRTLLFDFPRHRLLLDPASAAPGSGRASALSDIRTRNADTAVRDVPDGTRPLPRP